MRSRQLRPFMTKNDQAGTLECPEGTYKFRPDVPLSVKRWWQQENKRFYQHNSLMPKEIGRALVRFVINHVLLAGRALTQQLVKVQLLDLRPNLAT